jgi:hypothetical protein
MSGEIQIAGNFVGTGVLASGGQVTTAASQTSGAGLNVPPGTPPTSAVPGDIFNDTTRKNLGISGIAGGSPVWLFGCVQTQPQQTSFLLPVGSPSTICSFNALDAGILSSVGKRLIVTGSGMFSTALGEVPTLTLKLFLLTKALITITTDAFTASLTDQPFKFHFEVLTQTAGASGVVRATGILHISIAAGVVKTYIYSPNNPTTAIDLTSPGAPLIQATANVTQLTSITINETSLHITN